MRGTFASMSLTLSTKPSWSTILPKKL